MPSSFYQCRHSFSSTVDATGNDSLALQHLSLPNEADKSIVTTQNQSPPALITESCTSSADEVQLSVMRAGGDWF